MMDFDIPVKKTKSKNIILLVKFEISIKENLHLSFASYVKQVNVGKMM